MHFSMKICMKRCIWKCLLGSISHTIICASLENPFMVLNKLLGSVLSSLWLKLLLKVFQSKNDHNLFIKRSEQHITITDVYVDDIILSSKYMSSITTLKTHLHNTFSIKDLRIFHYFLGIEVGEGVVRKRKDCWLWFWSHSKSIYTSPS